MKKKSSIKTVLVLLITSVMFLVGLLAALKLTNVIKVTWLGILSPFALLAFILFIVAVAWIFLSILNGLINNWDGR